MIIFWEKCSCFVGFYRIIVYDCFFLIYNVVNMWVFVKVKYCVRELIVIDFFFFFVGYLGKCGLFF